MEISKDYIYVGLFLTERSKEKIKGLISSLPKYNELLGNANKLLIEHCTLLHRNQEKDNKHILERLSKLELSKPLDEYESKSAMVATHIGFLDGKAMAIKVVLSRNIPCVNKTPHITICTFGDGKPFDSNKITNWEKLPHPLYIQGYLRVIEKSIKK